MDENLGEFVCRCRGAILGSAFGDALGFPVEGMTAEQIRQHHGHVTDYLPSASGIGRYSDDTQMTLATGLSLVRQRGLEGSDCARSCAELFDPARGYGRSAMKVLAALQHGRDHRETGRMLFPSGSYGNGAAMRIAPVGLMYGHLSAAQLRSLVMETVLSTHVHVEAIDAALLVALFVGRVSRLGNQAEIDLYMLFSEFSEHCQDQTIRRKINRAWALLNSGVDDCVAVEQLGNGVRSSESVVLALFMASRYIDNAEAAIINAVHCGGDADTIAAIVGAIVGARHGDHMFPDRWHAGLERGLVGYDALVEMAEALASTTYRKGFFIDFSM